MWNIVHHKPWPDLETKEDQLSETFTTHPDFVLAWKLGIDGDQYKPEKLLVISKKVVEMHAKEAGPIASAQNRLVHLWSEHV
jgi:hypothetical protein